MKRHLVTIQSTHDVDARTRHSDVKNIDWNDSSDRKWLMNHLHWAMMNQVSVTLNPAEPN